MIHGIWHLAQIDAGKGQPEQLAPLPGVQCPFRVKVGHEVQHIHQAVPLAVHRFPLRQRAVLGQVLQGAGGFRIAVHRRRKVGACGIFQTLPQGRQRLDDPAAGGLHLGQGGGVILRGGIGHALRIAGEGAQPVLPGDVPDEAVIFQGAGLLGRKPRGGGAGQPQDGGGFQAAGGSLQRGEQEKRQRREEDVLLFAAEVGQIVLLQHGFGIAVAVQVPAEDDAIPVAEALLPHQPGNLGGGKPHFLVHRRRLDKPKALSGGGGHRFRPGKGPLQPGQGGALVAFIFSENEGLLVH